MVKMKKCGLISAKIRASNQRGAILIWLIFMIIAISSIGTSMVFLTASSTNDELLANNQERAYFIAESGGRLGIPQIQEDPNAAVANLNGQIFILSGGDKFQLQVTVIDSVRTRLVSTGIVNEGSFLEGKRVVTYEIVRPIYDEPFNDDQSLNNWNIVSGAASIKTSGPSDGEPALNLKGEESFVTLDWQSNPDIPDLAEIRSQNNGLLSYELQLKMKADVQGSKGDHYMAGLSFRVDTFLDNLYGISFFWSKGRNDTKKPAWIDDLPATFDVLMDENNRTEYIVLWKKISGVFLFVDYKLLTAADGVKDASDDLKAWSTIVVRVIETKNGTRQNAISGFVQGTDVYPRNTISWDFDNFNPASWNMAGTQTVVNAPPTSAVFDDAFRTNNLPAEIGIHGFYDSPASNDEFFEDFAMRLISSSGQIVFGAIQF